MDGLHPAVAYGLAMTAEGRDLIRFDI